MKKVAHILFTIGMICSGYGIDYQTNRIDFEFYHNVEDNGLVNNFFGSGFLLTRTNRVPVGSIEIELPKNLLAPPPETLYFSNPVEVGRRGTRLEVSLDFKFRSQLPIAIVVMSNRVPTSEILRVYASPFNNNRDWALSVKQPNLEFETSNGLPIPDEWYRLRTTIELVGGSTDFDAKTTASVVAINENGQDGPPVASLSAVSEVPHLFKQKSVFVAIQAKWPGNFDNFHLVSPVPSGLLFGIRPASEIFWQSQPGKKYLVETKFSVGTSWREAAAKDGTGGEVSVLLPNSAKQQFYRVRER